MNFKKLIKSNLPLLTLVIVVFSMLGIEGQAQVGFQAEFNDLPNVVSKFDSTTFQFSAAQYPKTYANFSRAVYYQPKIKRSSDDEGRLTFETTYRGIDSLVPISVDAKQLFEYRRVKRLNDYRSKAFKKSHAAARRGDKKSGLNMGIKLPERFNRMFGEGGANLRVNGYRKIIFSGRSQWADGQSEVMKQSKFPSLKMDQNYRLDITGTIGSKISVKVSEDSRSEVPLANRIQIRYNGDEDDILKTIEAGNTNLNLPRSQFVGYSSRIQGLFGIKVEAQIGRLSLTAIASQEKGSAEKARISAGGEEGAEFVRDYDYQQGRIFDLGPDTSFGQGDSVIYVEIWEEDRSGRNNASRVCQIYVDPNDTSYASTYSELGKMVQLDQSISFELINDLDKPTPYVIFNNPRFSGLSLGMYLIIGRDDGTIDTIGSKSSDEVILKTLRLGTGTEHPSSDPWQYMWRNVYKVPANVEMKELHLVIKQGKANAEEDLDLLDYQIVNGVNQGEYFKILGLDQYDTKGGLNPDNQVDSHEAVFRSDLGLLIFPSRTPFNTDTTYLDQDPLDKNERVPSIYSYTSTNEKTQDSKYFIQYSVSTRSATIHLKRANIIEGSERVTLNGAELTKNVDYTINYDFGQLTILKDEALDPNAELNVDFEYAPFLAIQKKTLMGIRAEYVWNRNLKFGSTILYKSDKAQDRKPRVGQETAEMTVMDFDFAFKVKPSFITKAVNALPFFKTEAVSNLSVEGELAQSRPNPNVDNVAYIDDFESSHEKLSLGAIRAHWSIAAKPGHLDDEYQRAKILWHNTLYAYPAIQVYNRENARGDNIITPFRVVFRPDTLSIDTLSVDTLSIDTLSIDTVVVDEDTTINVNVDINTFAHTIENSRTPSWGGIVRGFGNRVDQKRVQVLELRVKGKHGRIHLDFGKINEDVNDDGILANEDPSGDNFITEVEDVGLDGLADVDEPGYDSLTNTDPAGDNWFFMGDGICPVPASECGTVIAKQKKAQDGDRGVNNENDSLYYEWLNGTEGNWDDITSGARADNESMTNSNLKTNDAYFSYVINLDTAFSRNFLVEGTENEYGWKTYRIPVKDSLLVDTIFTSETARPTWSEISHIRIWFENDGKSSTHDTIEVADWYFVQSNWQDSLDVYPIGISNSSFVVSTISAETGNFNAPPGVAAYKDVANDVTETHRGLLLDYENLRANDTCIAYKELLSIERYSGYRNLEVYVRGDTINVNDSIQFFFRVGEDAENFYEYQVPHKLYPGWDERNYININFDSVTVLKDFAQRNLAEGKTYKDVNMTSGPYRVRGDPSINEVTYFSAGIVNMDPASEVSGEIWLDEMRVTNVRKDVGTAARISASGNLADLLTYSFNYDTKDAFFRGISTATRGGGNDNLGSGNTQENYRYGLSLNIHRFLPKSMGLRLPISYNFSRSVQKPLLRVRSDIVLTDELREKEKKINETQSMRISESFAHKGKNILYDALLNRQKFTLSYSRSNSSSPNRPKRLSETINVSGDFDAGWRKPPTLPIFFFLKSVPILKKTSSSNFSIFPSTWKFSGKFNRSLSISDDDEGKRTSQLSRDFSGNMRLKYDLFKNLSFTYNFDTKRDLSDPDKVNLVFNLKKLKIGEETSYRQNFSTSYDPKLINWFTSVGSFSSSYAEKFDRIKRNRKGDLKRSWSMSGSFKHQELLGGKSSGQRSGGRRVRTTRRGTRAGVDDAKAKEKDKKKGKFYDKPLAGVRFLTNWMNPFTYKYSESFSQSTPGLLGRPGWTYRLGFLLDPDAPIGKDTRSPSASKTVNYEFGSGFSLLGGIVTTVKFKRGISTDLVRQGNRAEKISTAWPSLSIRINQFKTFPLFKNQINKFIKIFAPRTSYSRDTKEDFNLTGGFKTNETQTTNYSPLLSLSFKMFRGLSLSGSYTLNESKRVMFEQSDGELVSTVNSERRSMAFTAQYSFSAPGGIKIPIFGKLKFKSDVSINIKVSKNENNSEKVLANGTVELIDDKSDFSVSPNISYSFSRQVKGGITARWQDTADNKTNRKNHVRELQIWAEIRF